MNNDPPEPPRRRANLFERIAYLCDAATFLTAEQLNARHQMEQIMTQGEQLASEVATLRTNVSNLASEISSEIADLAAAIAQQGTPDPAVADAIAALQATNTQLTSLTGSLSADNPPAAPTS